MSESIVIMTIGPLLTIVPSIPPLFVGQPGAISFSASGAEGLLRWTLVSSDLPAEWDTAFTITDGVASLETAEVIDPGKYSVRVRLSDATRVPVEQTYSVRIVALPIEVSGTLDDWTVTVAITDVLTLSGGTGHYVSATVISGSLPAGVGVTLDGAELQFTGSPTGSGAWAVVLRVTDDGGAYLDIPLSGTIDVLPLTITGGPLADGTEGEVYSDTLTIGGGVPPYSLGTVSGVPAGLSVDIDGSAIEISGTPAADESDDSPFSLSIEVEDAEAETEVYTQSFVVQGNGDPYWANVVALLHLNGSNGSTSIVDETGRSWTAHGNAAISTAESVFNGSSAYFDGTGDWIDTPYDSDFNAGTQDFVFELRVKSPGNGAFDQITAQRNASGDGFAAYAATRVSSGPKLFLSYTTSGGFVTATSADDVFDDAWHYLAFVRTGTSYRMYVDGNLSAELTLPGSFTFDSLLTSLSIGRAGDYDGQYYKGYVAEYRLTVGTDRGYTGSTIPVPSAPFPDGP